MLGVSFVFHCIFVTVCTYWWIDLLLYSGFSCTVATASNKLTYLLTYLWG